MRYTLLILVIALFSSCDSDIKEIKVKDYTTENEAEIKQYIEDNDLVAERSDSGLYYVIAEPGNGDQPTASSNVTVAYKGYFTNGEVFDESNEDGISFPLNGVISGWTEGIPYFKEGGTGKLLIPSNLAYGPYGRGAIPGGAVLIFDIELKSIN